MQPTLKKSVDTETNRKCQKDEKVEKDEKYTYSWNDVGEISMTK